MDINIEIAKQAGERWLSNEREVIRNIESIERNDIQEIETDERLKKRLERYVQNRVEEPEVFAEAAIETVRKTVRGKARAADLLGQTLLERIIDKSDLMDINFLEKALAVSRFVGRVAIKRSSTVRIGHGTGFMVSPKLMITNNHVLSSVADAKFSEIEFDYQYDRFGRLRTVNNFRFEPHKFFMTDKTLDFTIVAVSDKSVNGKASIDTYGWSRLIGEEGKAIKGEALNIIQHPRGRTKQIAFRSNPLTNLLDKFAHYGTDTEQGSSGSPVYNDEWEVVALHHSGVPKVENGQIIKKDGSVWRRTDDPEDILWIANEGIRISRIVKFIINKNMSSDEESLKRDMLDLEPPNPIEVAIMREAEEKKYPKHTYKPKSDNENCSESNKKNNISSNSKGGVSFTVPLQIDLSLGGGQSQTQSLGVSGSKTEQNNTAFSRKDVDDLEKPPQTNLDEVPIASSVNIDSEELTGALQELESARNRIYYDETADLEDRKTYYSEIDFDNSNSREVYTSLHELLKDTHKNKFRYKPAKHVYPWVDLHEDDGRFILKSVYSGESFNPREFIEADFAKEYKREQFKELLLRESDFDEFSSEEWIDSLEARFPYNCEHVVPQSWYRKREPMRGDLHHLFACESRCNSFRSNIPYYDFPDFEESVRDDCGKRVSNKFEPSAGKGAVARATLYFLIRYPGEIDETGKEYTRDRIEILIDWHKGDTVSRYEKHRNAAIYEKQGNRNPLIDFPDLVEKIDFLQGLG